eukprot:COSAG02_NODE_2_length_75708_cov_87.013953_48_plen_65_part_00
MHEIPVGICTSIQMSIPNFQCISEAAEGTDCSVRPRCAERLAYYRYPWSGLDAAKLVCVTVHAV